MELNEVMKKVKEACELCTECDPSCTGNMLLKCIENSELALNFS